MDSFGKLLKSRVMRVVGGMFVHDFPSRLYGIEVGGILRVSLPIELVVLNACVTDTKETLFASKTSTSLEKSISDRERRSTLYTTIGGIDFLRQ